MKQIARADGFDEVMRCHERRVLGVALRLTGNLADAQDAAQDVFLRLHRALPSLADDAIAPWLRRVTVNVCRDLIRRRKVRRLEPIGEEMPSNASGPDAAADRALLKDRIASALSLLGERERTALVLRDLEGLSTAEVADLMGVAESTIRVQIGKARLKLRELLRGLR